MKLIIAGSREFSKYGLLRESILGLYTIEGISEIVSGTANGADKLGEKFASEFNIKVVKFPAKWDAHGRSAGYIRNKEMAKYADACIVFWDGKSKGTKHMLDLAKEYKLKLNIIYF